MRPYTRSLERGGRGGDLKPGAKCGCLAVYLAMSSARDVAAFFPLHSLGDALKFFRAQVGEAASDPDLALLSIVTGCLEHQWTAAKNAPVAVLPPPPTESALTPSSSSSSSPSVPNACEMRVEPPLEWHVVDTLCAKFAGIIEGFCDPNLLQAARNAPDSGPAVRPLVKHVADIVWNTLSKSQYKDRPHLQSVYSYLTGRARAYNFNLLRSALYIHRKFQSNSL